MLNDEPGHKGGASRDHDAENAADKRNPFLVDTRFCYFGKSRSPRWGHKAGAANYKTEELVVQLKASYNHEPVSALTGR
jgi:hypothetical protein